MGRGQLWQIGMADEKNPKGHKKHMDKCQNKFQTHQIKVIITN